MLGALIALCAAIAFGTGSVLQKVGAPPADAVGMRRLAQHVVWHHHTSSRRQELDLLQPLDQ